MGTESSTVTPETVRFVHDLRNCIAAVRAAASMLRRPGSKPEVVEQIADGLYDQVHQMMALIDDFIGVKAQPLAPSPGAAAGPSSSLHVLVVDNNVDAANALAMFLRLEGHRAVVAFDGEHAFSLAAADHPQVMLLDLTMPGKSGFDLASEVRSQPWGGGLQLIAVSGLFSPEDRARATAAGFDAQLSKPIDLDKLQTLLLPAQ